MGVLPEVAFRHIKTVPIASATAPSTNQQRSHRSCVGWKAAIMPAAIAVTPITTAPQPGMAVNEAERAITSRMNRRCDSASSPDPIDSEDLNRGTGGLSGLMAYVV
jgi:hypothetical protein